MHGSKNNQFLGITKWIFKRGDGGGGGEAKDIQVPHALYKFLGLGARDYIENNTWDI